MHRTDLDKSLRKLFSDIRLMFGVLVIVVANSFFSLTLEEAHWFGRSGSLLVIVGIWITARRIIRLGKEHLNEDWNFPDETSEGRKVLFDQRAQYIIGPTVAFIGTIIWGYGDKMLEYLRSI